MKELEDKIIGEGKQLAGDILKVDSFLNHQIDVAFAEKIGKAFTEIYGDRGVNKILTIEASGIIFAVMTSQAMGNVPVVFAKKVLAHNMSEEQYTADCYSYTRQLPYHVAIAKEYLGPQDRVLIIDDFLANGEAMGALIDICHQAGAEIIGCGAVIEKSYQKGRKRIEELGVEVHSLACVASMDENGITFGED